MTFESRLHTEFDNRSVILSRPNATDEQTVGNTTTGNTLFATRSSLQTTIENPQTINAILGGPWDANSVYSWRPRADADTKLSHTENAPLGNLMWDGSEYIGTPTPARTVTISYTITDPDGVMGTATYKLTCHDPIEMLSNTTSIVFYDTDYLDGNNQPFVTTGPATTSGGSYGQGQSTSYGCSPTATTGGLEQFKTSFGFGSSWPHSNTSAVALTPTNNGVVLTAGQFVNLVIRHNFNRHHAIFYKYDANGKVRRFVTVTGGTTTEVPQEAFEDEYSNSEVRWSKIKNSRDGFPTPSTPQSTSPVPPSYTYS